MVNNMRFKALLLLVFTGLFSVSVLADTYSAIQGSPTYCGGKPSQNAACAAMYGGSSSYHSATNSCTDFTGVSGMYSPPSCINTPEPNYSCPATGTLSGTNCINATPCPTGSVRNTTTGICPAVITCSSSQYNLAGVCTTIPDCNSSSPTGGNYFDTVGKACASVSPADRVLCVNNNDVYCPPISDCRSPGYICTNDPATVAAAATSKAAAITTAKSSADQSVSAITSLNSQASTPISADTQAVSVAQANASTAKAALATVQANPSATADQLTAAASNYSSSLNAVALAQTKLTNAQASLASITTALTQATTADNAIPTSATSGHASGYAATASSAATDAQNSFQDAVVGGGSGSGSVGSSTLPNGVNCPGCAQDLSIKSMDAHIQGLDGDIKALSAGSGNSVTSITGKDSFDNSTPDAAVAQAKADYQAKFTQVQTSIKALFKFSGSDGGSLPVVEYGNIKGVNVTSNLNRYSSELSYVGLTIMFVAALISVLIILG